MKPSSPVLSAVTELVYLSSEDSLSTYFALPAVTSDAAINKAKLLVVSVDVGTSPKGSVNPQAPKLIRTWDVWGQSCCGSHKSSSCLHT